MKQFNNLKIGIDIRNIGKKRTGDEVVFFELVRSLREISTNYEFYEITNDANKRGINFYLFTDITDTTLLYSNVVKPLGIENRKDFEIISLKSPNKFIWNLWTLPRYLRKHPVNVYHTQYIAPFFVSRKIKIITHIHDVSFKAHKQFIKWSDLFFLKFLIPLSIKRADKIIAVSEFTKNEIIKYYFKSPLIPLWKRGKLREKVEVVYNAVSSPFTRLPARQGKGRAREGFEKREGKESVQDNDDFQIPLNPPFPKGEKKERGEDLKKKYNLPEKFILYIGTLQPRKNIPMLIKAYLKIKDRIPGIKLVIAGNRDAYNVDSKLKTQNSKLKIKESGIIFPGFIDEEDKMALIGMAHLFVFPSLYEGFGIPILEAMSQNVPVAASDIPSLSEVGDNAYVKFNPQNLDEMAEKLYTACVDKDLRNKLIELGQSRVKFFSWEKSAEKMLKIYDSLVRVNYKK